MSTTSGDSVVLYGVSVQWYGQAMTFGACYPSRAQDLVLLSSRVADRSDAEERGGSVETW